MPFMVVVCLILTACDKDDVLRGEPMVWSYEILTPDNVKFLGSTDAEGTPKYSFEANGKQGDVIMTCENFFSLNPISGDSYTYDCGWAMLRVDANQVKIHFLQYVSDAQSAYEEIRISANDGEKKVYTIICLSRNFKDEGHTDPEPETLPEEAKFKMIMNDFTPLMHLDSPLPAPLDLITFRITDVNGEYSPIDFPVFTHYYDSIVWSADNFPHTFRVYENRVTAEGVEKHISTQWSSHFFKSGTIKSHLKGYRDGKAQYETSHNMTLYERDFLGLQWGIIVMQKPENLTAYCLLDRDYEYKVYDIVATNDAPYSQIIPMNHKLLSDADFLPATEKAIKTLMKNNVGGGEDGKGKENLFKCLPGKGVEAEWYWENETTRMLMLHRLSDGTNGPAQEKYYLHIEPK